ncbi:MAG: GNAT family N-acetyltransferase [Pyrinomonadaceae bacterium]
MKVLETDRLTLRYLTLADAEFILQLLNQPSFIRFIGDRGVRTVEDARKYILQGPIASYERFGFGLYLTEITTTGAPVGICGLLKRDTLPDADIGFAFLAPFWRQGFAFESASAVITYGKDELGQKRILAITSPENDSSIKLLEKLGFTFEQITRLSEDAPEVNLFALDL